ncbi:type IV pilus assembly protein PilM [Halanaerobium hydrogeniformans]|uniref:Type IV pilus assembly protein PilM n=1 Tax=Halanaerobium hydrogeniformans TaxID=656519 RepID=E4RLE9_HALHG|nr:type IV pilus assembly protein PilM [Halanaerobium hydrogeniformans]ADQ14863.1 type IV pilus assembly protein PilM [Halanaerobium hydrogeniformans]
MFFKSNIFTCVDIGSYSIKIAQIKKTGGDNFKILDTALQKIPKETIVDGIIKDESLIAAEIKSLLAIMKKKPDYVITAVPSNELLVRNIEMPKMDKKEIKESLKWEADEQIPYPVENAALDYIKVDEDENTVNYLISAVKKNIVDNYKSPFERNNLKVEVINVIPMALISLLDYQEELKGNIAIIDIGYSASQVTVANKNNIILSRTIDTGGNHFTKTIMDVEDLEYDEAEEKKIKEGLKIESNSDPIDSMQLDAALGSDDRLKTLAGTLTGEITRSFNYFSIKKRKEDIDKIFITGGGSRLKGLKEFMEKELGRDIYRIDTFKNIAYPIDDEIKDDFAVAIGLGISEVMADES